MNRTSSSHLFLSALLPLSLAACASGATGTPVEGGSSGSGGGGGNDSGITVTDGTEFTLAPGASATLADDSRLHYVRLVNDSRCPPDKQCVWAGDAIVAFQWTPASGVAQEFELHTGLEPRSQTIGTRTISLKSLARSDQPEATLLVEATP